jgi:hypothetical protein
VYGSGNISQYIPYGEMQDKYDIYPQYIIDLFQNCGILSECVENDAMVIQGRGFTQKDFAEMQINKEGHTVSFLLSQSANDLSLFGGFAWLINFNAIGDVINVTHVPFERCRRAMPDKDTGYIKKTVIIDRYDLMMYGISKTNSFNATAYDNYQENRQDFASTLSELSTLNDFSKYQGQIYYFFNEKAGSRYYPKPKFHAVLKDCETLRACAESLYYDVEDRFKASTIIYEFGKTQLNDDERKRIVDEYQEFSGSAGARIQVRFCENKESAPIIEKIESPDLAKNYEFAEKSRQSNVRRNFKYPEIIYGIAQAGKLGLSNEMESSIEYANLIAEKDRNSIVSAFKKVFSRFVSIEKYNPMNDYSIKPFTILNQITQQIQNL